MISRAKRYTKKRNRAQTNATGSKSRFKRGFYSPINESKYIQPLDKTMNKGELPEYRSSWELEFYKYCDINDEILSWTTEPFPIKYIKPTDGQVHRYFPDVLVKFSDGKNFLIEIKPFNQTQDPINISKWEAATAFCENKDLTFIVMTENELKSIIKIGKK